tara:strand:+ start:145 stop:444 length:300 start_codon:yes stop_codon:yes gene_type:complete
MSIIDIHKLKRNCKIIVETVDAVYEIVVSGPKSSSVIVTGGKYFLRPTRCIISEEIKKNETISFSYKDNNQNLKILKTSEVETATIYASDESWKYDVIE